MKYRKLRIAWSVAWGAVSMLLTVLWVRSYWDVDCVKTPRTPLLLATSFNGRLCITSYKIIIPQSQSGWGPGWGYTTEPSDRIAPDVAKTSIWFYLSAPDVTVFTFPCWVPVLLTTIFAGAPWLPRPKWQFTVRTLLIATTLVAIVLGLIVWRAH